MTSFQLLLWIALGIALQLGLFLAINFWQHWQSYLQLAQGQAALPKPKLVTVQPAVDAAAWAGFRDFKVVRRVVEDAAGQICSFYLTPEDGARLPPFKPGQFLTFRLMTAATTDGEVEPLVRCYSLSDAPNEAHYRISVKRVAALAPHPPGRSSNAFHDLVQVGERLQVRAPAGHFYLPMDNSPVVLIAGGIGITPLLSMLNTSLAQQAGREVWLFYAVRNSRELAFGQTLRSVAANHPNVHLRLCFSAPLPQDQQGRDFNHVGRVDVNLLRMALPLKPYHYYLCGPTAMMAALVKALDDWGVPESHIHFEAFGPASIQRPSTQQPATGDTTASPQAQVNITFAKSGKTIPWSPQAGSLLDFAEKHGILIHSGCRAGGCGSCQTPIQAGEVRYSQTPDFDPEPGTCLMCVCTPKTPLTLEA